MICIMHQGEPYGHLTVKGVVVQTPMLARMVGCSLREATNWLRELESAKVFSRTDSGEIYSRRMVKDESLRSRRAEYGKLGGNPALLDKPNDGIKVNPHDKPQPTPSPSSSSSSSSSKPPPPNTLRELEEEVFQCGVEDAVRAVRSATDAGCSNGEIRAVIAAWSRRDDLGPGSLHYRLMELRPGQEPDRGWPKQAPEVVQKKQAGKRADAERRDEEEYQEKVVADAATAKAREEKFGPELDAMDQVEVGEICKPFPAMFKLFKKKEPSPLLRAWLLSQLERRVQA